MLLLTGCTYLTYRLVFLCELCVRVDKIYNGRLFYTETGIIDSEKTIVITMHLKIKRAMPVL